MLLGMSPFRRPRNPLCSHVKVMLRMSFSWTLKYYIKELIEMSALFKPLLRKERFVIFIIDSWCTLDLCFYLVGEKGLCSLRFSSEDT